MTLPQKQIGQLIDQVSFAMAQQDVRVFLNGMLLEISENTLRAVATDGHRLAMASKPCQSNAGSGTAKQAIVPRKAVVEMGRLLDEEEEDLSIQLGSNHLKVTKGGVTLTTKLVDGQFPDYEKLCPRMCHEFSAVIGIRSDKVFCELRFYPMKNTGAFDWQ